MIDNGGKLGYFAGFMKFWQTIIAVAAACFAGGFWETTAQETPEPETLEIQYTLYGNSYTNQVAKDVGTLLFNHNITVLHLPEGLTKLHALSIFEPSDSSGNLDLTRLILPKDVGKDADWPLRVVIARLSDDFTLQVHKDMGQFSLVMSLNRSEHYLPVRIPSAKNLIRNREPDDDGVFRISMSSNPIDEGSRRFTIEVHGVEPQIWLNRQEGGVEIVWDRGQLQSAPSIDGPWTDITFDDTRRLFLRSSSPAEFFRVKP